MLGFDKNRIQIISNRLHNFNLSSFIINASTWSSIPDRGVLYKVSGVAQVHGHTTAVIILKLIECLLISDWKVKLGFDLHWHPTADNQIEVRWHISQIVMSDWKFQNQVHETGVKF